MKKILLTGLFAVLIAAGFAQKPYKVVFYNFENLFDTIDDPGTRTSTRRRSATWSACCSTSPPRTEISRS